jgi:hypothetical protein
MMLLTHLLFITLYVAFCWVMGHLGRNTKFGFWGNFWVSIILTPIFGFIILLAQDSRPGRNKPNPEVRT